MSARLCKICDTPLKPHQKKFCCRTCAANGARGSKDRVSDQEYIDDVLNVKSILGHYPTNGEYFKHGNYHPASLYWRFGPWSKVLEIAGYIEPKPTWSIDDLSPEEGGWLAGLFAGEGHFTLVTNRSYIPPRFYPFISVTQREDNHMVLAEVIRLWGLGDDKKLYRIAWRDKSVSRKKLKRNPTLQLKIGDVLTLYYRVLPTFTRFPMRSKKQDEFIVFVKAIELLYNRRQEHRQNLAYTDEERNLLASYYKQLQLLKVYKPPETLPFDINSYIGNYKA